jgi:hypothetical protein
MLFLALLIFIGIPGAIVWFVWGQVHRAKLDPEARAEFDRKHKDHWKIAGVVTASLLMEEAARVNGPRAARRDAAFRQGWDLDGSQAKARQIDAYNQQVARHNVQIAAAQRQVYVDPITYNNAAGRAENWYLQHGGRMY